MRTYIKLISYPLVISIILILVCSIFPWFTEHVYFRVLFQIQRILHDFTIGLLPVPSIYLALLILLFTIIFIGRTKIEMKKDYLFYLLYVLSWLFAIFYITWGCHYQLTPLETRLELDIPMLKKNDLILMFEEQGEMISNLRMDVSQTNVSFQDLENEIRPVQEKLLEAWSLPTYGRVRVRKVPSGALLHFRTTGIYIPHAFEGHVDGGLYAMQWPFTLAHEMAHGYGMAYESDCNFIAYLTCLESDNPLIRYSGELAYWRYLASQVARLDNEYYLNKKEELNPDVISDLSQIRAHIDKFKDLMPKYRTVIYDNYLKSHGIAEGVLNYDRMILLVEAWKRKNTH